MQALIDAQRRGEIPSGKITAVISSNPVRAYALERAQQAGITGITIARKNFGSAREMTVALVDTLRELDIGLVVMAGFMVIITNGAGRGISQRDTQYSSLADPVLLRQGLRTWTPCP